MAETERMQVNRSISVERDDIILSQANGSFRMNMTPNTILLNVSSIDESINSFYFYEREQFLALGFLFFGIVIGNGAVLSALLLGRSRKSRMNYFIMQLAIADLLVGLISVGTDIAWRFTVEWLAGNVACKLIRYLQAAVTYSSTYVLVALSIDRYDAITHPMNFSGSWFRARCLVAGAWCLSLLFATPNSLLFRESVIQSKIQCWCHLSSHQWQIYISLVSVALFILPAVIISACYASIVCTIWSKSKQLAPAIPRLNGHLDEDEDTRRASSRGLIPRAKIKTIKMTFVIVFVFILCWSPYIVFDLLQVFGHIPNTQTNIAVATFIQSLAPLNSAANPIIYCAFSSHICGNLRKVPPLKWILGGSRGGRFGNSRTDTSSLTEGISSRLRSLHVNTRSHSLHTINSHKL